MPPPNDDLFSDDQDPNPAAGAAAAGPKLAEQLASLNQSLGRLVETQTATNQRVEALTQRVAQGAEPAAEEEASVGADGKPLSPQAKKFSKFYDDPESFIRDEAGRLVNERLGPHLLTQARQKAKELEAVQAAKIDTEFGTGTWDSEYAKDFGETLGKLPLEMQSNHDHVEAAVAAIHGRKFLTPETRKGLEGRRDTVEKARVAAAAPAMLGNGAPRQRSATAELSAEEGEFLATLNRNGHVYTKELYIRSRGLGSKESTWRVAKVAATAKAAKANGKGA